MAAGVHKFTIEQGVTWTKQLSLRAPDPDHLGPPEGAPKVPVDLSGCSARMQIRKDVRTSTPMVELTTDNGRITLGGETGLITLRLNAEDTAALTRDGVYDLELIDAQGEVIRLLKGQMALDRETTR
jgi:tRNA threonylcarbamoyladenosine modification (KEOPS) complex  Pcc1 subunit